MSHKNSKTVTVFRAGSFLSRAQGSDVEDFMSTTKKSIGSYWESTSSKRIATGLSFAEEAMLLPMLLDVPAEDREFRKKVTLFYTDIDTQVPHGAGRVLEIGLEGDNDKPVNYPKNMPLNLMDYLRYRHILKHPHVAPTKEEADGNQLKEFYIFDKTDVIKKNVKRNEEKDTSIQIYLKLKNEPTQVDAMLTVLGVDPREFVGPDAADLRAEELRRLSESDPGNFVKTYNAADLEIRYWIGTMVNTNVLKKIGEKFLNAETNKPLANNEEEMIFFFKDEDNSETVSLLKARMQEAVKKPLTKRTNRNKVVA